MQLCCSLRVRGYMDAHAGSILPSSIAKLYQKGDADLAAKSDQPKAEVERGTEGVDVKMQTKSNRVIMPKQLYHRSLIFFNCCSFCSTLYNESSEEVDPAIYTLIAEALLTPEFQL
ncbi:hypothetical protein BUALT_Bualt15G0094400 [Buddleja alternifolia]|uniref:Uncharacterized protein n=1 Tax=Buddleja alternifolia TaxID=168488 RepID=A0AAV6WFC3_9LAMI|nr:hypothetical protein BUALT_Bualt15G0094400 [Buddleja alternifolia]